MKNSVRGGLLATIEPLTGKRIADVFDQRRKVEFALHFQHIAENYPGADKIIEACA